MKPNVIITHIFREQNRLTDGLAKSALRHSRDTRVFDRPPASIQAILADDMMGIPNPRCTTNEDHTS